GPTAGAPRVQVSSALTDAFAAALGSPTERAAVFEGDRFLGTFTATSLLASLRRASAEGGNQVAAGICCRVPGRRSRGGGHRRRDRGQRRFAGPRRGRARRRGVFLLGRC